MDRISIGTTQNVALEYEAAGVGSRMLAIFLDTLFKYAYLLIIILLYNQSRKTFISYEDMNYEDIESRREVLTAIAIVFLLPYLTYHFLCETFMNGQSFGKKIVKIKVVKLDGTRPNFSSYLLRSMFRIIDDNIIGIITIAVSKKSQRFGDMVAGTTVIRLNPEVSLQETILHRHDEAYEVVYPEVAMMTDHDAGIIREVLEFSETQQNVKHVAILAEKIRAKYGIVKGAEPDEIFLETILRDYTHYQFEK